MSSANRPNRKATDQDIIRLNSVGLSLRTIGKQLGCHPTTITLRLNDLGVPPANTRRAFMEEIYNQLSDSQKSWLEAQLGPKLPVKDFILNLIVQRYIESQNP
jgi:hypothetical protein